MRLPRAEVTAMHFSEFTNRDGRHICEERYDVMPGTMSLLARTVSMTARIQLLAFRIESRSYALRLSHVQRVIRSVDVTPVPETPSCVLGIIDVHGEILPVLNFRRRI